MQTATQTFQTFAPTLKPLTDQAVNRWLAQNHPALARELHREQVHIEIQQKAELPLGALSQEQPGALTEPDADFAFGVHYSELGLPEKHYLFVLFPDCGRAEICETVRPFLTENQHRALCLTFGAGLTLPEAGPRMGVSGRTVTRCLTAARQAIVEAAAQGVFPRPCEATDTLGMIARLMGPPTLYRRIHKRVPRRAYVCDCGRHLTWQRLVHPMRKWAPGEQRRYTCPCGRRYTETERRKLAA